MSSIAPSSTTAGLLEIDKLAHDYSTARAIVTERINSLNDELRDLHRRRLPGIKAALLSAKTAQEILADAIRRHADLFIQPRTIVLHGIRIGLKKGSGKLEWEVEDDILVARIERMFSDDPQALETYIIVERKPAKEALKNLDAKQLAKLGATVEGTGDFVVIADSDTEAKKLVKRILKEGAVYEVDSQED